ncbi:MAG: bifunctional (p)ppGpp synthetase/guanosine-3',5'-bis(diphosphate) 3'-pyrophosphohydrolase, partial [Burkholderiaceae bacterium]|nr:bifunctional (p)ppGpp synthetase/guanosine-3',5'-bis(diphosphate) 3'-pyrophosphohydrolase [Burkholderiaceae bacterium]
MNSASNALLPSGTNSASISATQADMLARARTFAEPFLVNAILDTGENTWSHAQAVAQILCDIGGSVSMQAASYLIYTCDHLNKPLEVISQAFDENLANLAVETTKLMRVQKQTRAAVAAKTNPKDSETAAARLEAVRKMLLAFSRDLRVVMLRLASRLQTLRYFAASKTNVMPGLARESLEVFAPLANRLGIWQIKWEMEDLSFRFLEPETYRQVARLLDEKRSLREDYVAQLRDSLQADLAKLGIAAEVQGRPKHIYSIIKKMRGKALDFDQVFDIRALRVVVSELDDCYAVLSWVHAQFSPIPDEFDDYIAKPKANGYQSLHTVVRDAAGQAIEIQIRTQAMHDKAEHGVAAHWVYKEAGTKGYTGVSATGSYDAKIAVLRQLLAWERDLTDVELSHSHSDSAALMSDRIYVLTPDAAVIELPQGATAIDFAYTVHTSLGHRCRGVRLDGVMVPLNTPLKNGQTVEVTTAKEGGPSRDWLNPELGFLSSHRAKAKVRAWFNALAMQETIARGREAVEKLLQREGKTAIKLVDLATQLGFKSADELFEVVGKDEYSLRTIEAFFKPPVPVLSLEETFLKKSKTDKTPKGGVLVVGVDSLLTQLAKCCKPAPGDAIGGFVTRGKGVSIHRTNCSNFQALVARNTANDEGRVIEVAWANQKQTDQSVYQVDVVIEAVDHQGLLREILEVFSKDKLNVIAANTQSIRNKQGDTAWMTFTVEVSDSARLNKVLAAMRDVQGVRSAR